MKTLGLMLCLFFLYSCKEDKKKEAVLLANREAPLGWIYLKIYTDDSFEFISSGLRDEDIYPGKVKIRKDTLFFTYTDSIPAAGKTAIISDNTVIYIDGEYHERVGITLNKLKSSQ